MEESVDHVRGPEDESRRFGDVVAEGADLAQLATLLEGRFADDCLEGRVFAAPVSAPALYEFIRVNCAFYRSQILVARTVCRAIPVRIVTSKQQTTLVSIDDHAERAYNLNRRKAAKVFLVHGRLVPESEHMVPRMSGQRGSLLKGKPQLVRLRLVARLVQLELVDCASVPSRSRGFMVLMFLMLTFLMESRRSS